MRGSARRAGGRSHCSSRWAALRAGLVEVTALERFLSRSRTWPDFFPSLSGTVTGKKPKKDKIEHGDQEEAWSGTGEGRLAGTETGPRAEVQRGLMKDSCSLCYSQSKGGRGSEQLKECFCFTTSDTLYLSKRVSFFIFCFLVFCFLQLAPSLSVSTAEKTVPGST